MRAKLSRLLLVVVFVVTSFSCNVLSALQKNDATLNDLSTSQKKDIDKSSVTELNLLPKNLKNILNTKNAKGVSDLGKTDLNSIDMINSDGQHTVSTFQIPIKQDDNVNSTSTSVKKDSVTPAVEVSDDPFSNNAFSEEQMKVIRKLEGGTGKTSLRARYEMADESLIRPRPNIKDFERLANEELTAESFVEEYGYPDLVTGFGIPGFVYFLDGNKSVKILKSGIIIVDGEKITQLSNKSYGGAKEKAGLFLKQPKLEKK